MMIHSRTYLAKIGSPASLLRFALPSLIDLRNPDALDPLEVERDYWTNPENAKYHIYQALDIIPGFKEAREQNNIKVMAELYRKYVIGYPSKKEAGENGQLAFFYEVGGLRGLMTKARTYLVKISSAASLLHFALPSLIDLRNQDALDPLEVERDWSGVPKLSNDREDQAMRAKGGIDLTPANMNLQVKKEIASPLGIKFHLDPAMLEQLQNAPGFVPVIISVQPLKSLAEFLGLNPS